MFLSRKTRNNLPRVEEFLPGWSSSQVGPTVRMVAPFSCPCSPHLPRGEGGDGMSKLPYLDDNGITMTAKAAGRRQGSQ